jgi:hypothetical protein
MLNLSPTGVTIYWHPSEQAFDFAALIHNAGEPFSGQIDITLGATFVSEYIGELPGGVDAQFSTGQVNVTVPAGVTLNTGETYRSSYFIDIPFLPMPGEDYNYAWFQVFVDYELNIFEKVHSVLQTPPAPPVPLPPPGYAYQGAPLQDWWKLQPHFSGVRPEPGPVLGRITSAHP